MQRTAFLVAAALMMPLAIHAERTCTLLVDASSGATLRREGTVCDERTTPASSFKVALSVMGYDAGILVDGHRPTWPYKDEYKTWNDSWKHTTDPTSWLSESVVWFSQVLTRKLGLRRFQRYVDAFQYGNRDLTGHPGRNDGLTSAWLSSSLRIAPTEQATFIRKLLNRELPVSRAAIDRTMAIMPVFPLAGGSTAVGKTGSGYQLDSAGAIDANLQLGWFVGWVRRANRPAVVFVRLIEDDAPVDKRAGLRARDDLLAELPSRLSGASQ